MQKSEQPASSCFISLHSPLICMCFSAAAELYCHAWHVKMPCGEGCSCAKGPVPSWVNPGGRVKVTASCRELAELRSKCQTQQVEGDKVRQLLAYEESRRCSLEGTLDQSHKQGRDQQRSLQNKVCMHSSAVGATPAPPLSLYVH